MKFFTWLMLLMFFFNCKKETETPIVARDIKLVEIEPIFKDSLLDIRAIEILKDHSLAFAANNGVFGLYNPEAKTWQTSKKRQDSFNLHFRSVAHTSQDFFMLSIDNPAFLYKTGDNGEMDLVYREVGDGVFYDAMTFWDDKEGIAIGDSVDGCLSVIITRDGGYTWNKIPCSEFSIAAAEEECVLAASNTNIKAIGDKVWIGTTHGNIYFSDDRGESWTIFKTEFGHEARSEGINAIDFYDELNGFAVGGDYKNPTLNKANKIRTSDGGKTWEIVAENQIPGYMACVQYVPNSGGKSLVATSFTGMVFSKDSGNSWKPLSDVGFHSIRFLNDSVAYAAGPGKISKLTFKE